MTEYEDCVNCKVEHRTLMLCDGCKQKICLACYDDHNGTYSTDRVAKIVADL